MASPADAAREKLSGFLRRLDRERLPHRALECPDWLAARLQVEVGGEIWEVHVDHAGEVSASRYVLVDQELAGELALEGLFDRSAKAWRAAAADLGIEFRAPFSFAAASGEVVACAGWLPHFGGPRGALIVSRADADGVHEAAARAGYFASGLNPIYYERYDRRRFSETLRDWGWFGPADRRPDWL